MDCKNLAEEKRVGDQTWKSWGIFRVVLVTGAVAAAILLAAP